MVPMAMDEILTIRYLRALAVFYIRLTFTAIDVFETLEPLMKDYRKLRERHTGECSRITV
jgi:hypothetical protein